MRFTTVRMLFFGAPGVFLFVDLADGPWFGHDRLPLRFEILLFVARGGLDWIGLDALDLTD